MSDAHALLTDTIVLLGGATLAAPIFKKLGLGTVLGYLAAGVLLGPVFARISDGEQILSVAELGVVLLLFIVGLELKPSRLWQMRRDIFGLGSAQVILSGLVITAVLIWGGFPGWQGAVIAGFGLALSSTAFALQILDDDGDTNTRYGQRSFSILLLQDLAIVPLLALIPAFGSGGGEEHTPALVSLGIAVLAVGGLITAGRYLLTPLFQTIASTGAREAMIAAALFVVLGSAALMQFAGLSMAMGAFLAGLMLAESSYRHELEADIEPFRGILLAIFFIAVGLSLKLEVIADHWLLILVSVPLLMAAKAATLYVTCRIAGSAHEDAVKIAALLPQGGEFGFVLFTTAAAAGLFSENVASTMIAVVTLSMALTPLTVRLAGRFIAPPQDEVMDEDFEGAGADVLMIGFSRFGQIAAQVLLAGGSEVTVLDTSAERIRQAARFGFRIYFGDGQRKDVLISAGIEKAKIVAVCTQKKETTDQVIDLIQSEFPDVRIFARSYDRVHSLSLKARGVEYELRETLESGLKFGRKTLEGLGLGQEQAMAIGDDIRRRDAERLAIQAAEGISAGMHMLHSQPVRPEPLTKPKRQVEEIED
ncbi:monovalent cation:proton antiporter-2 (CPA2) family protein [Rhizobium sp. PAMB 3174]